MRNNRRNAIVYRLRNSGYRIDSKNRLIYKQEKGNRHLVDVLKNEYGFAETEEMFKSNVSSRIYLAHENDEKAERMFRSSGYVVVKHSSDSTEAAKNVIKCDIIYFGEGWNESWILILAKKLGKRVIIHEG